MTISCGGEIVPYSRLAVGPVYGWRLFSGEAFAAAAGAVGVGVLDGEFFVEAFGDVVELHAADVD